MPRARWGRFLSQTLLRTNAEIDRQSGLPMHDLTRYGVCCPNNSDYRAYELAIMDEILSGYRFDGIWLDMIFYLAFCACPARKKVTALSCCSSVSFMVCAAITLL